MYLFIIYKIIKHNDVQLTITFTFPGSAITLPFRQTLHLQNRVFDYSPERNIQDITSEFGFKASGRCPQSAESSYYWLKNKLWPHKILQIPNVGIPSTIQWRFYNAKRFAVIPEWQMEKKNCNSFQIESRAGWASKALKSKWKLFTGHIVFRLDHDDMRD